jgi:formamidase
MKSIEIDRSKRLKDQPTTGHNRYHPAIPPLVEVDPGEEVVLQTRDGVDGQLGPAATEAAMASMEAGAIHPLTGPVFVKGAQPGDVLEVEFVDIIPQPHAFSAIVPGLGFLRDICTTPFLVQWRISDGWATSPQLPKVRIPGAPFMGVSAVAPSAAELRAWTKREQDLLGRGGLVFPPDTAGAVPSRGPAATEGLRTLPPRENGGNFDVKQLTKGSKLLLPVSVEGACFSVGDGGGSLPGAQGRGRSPHAWAALLACRLLRSAGVGRAAALRGHHGHAHP